jgi:CxxC-x17-CxxC domain-containing protein
MDYVDKTLECQDCGISFTFSEDEQSLFASRGFNNEPKRCMECRMARKQQRNGGSYDNQQRREMFPAVCAECGVDTQVPFEPRQDRPVYCRECYDKVRLTTRV